ncbi:integrase core domain-containing protein [Pseudonocardia sp. RS010]|uniref:integrase core domain-containing protein n=1 Tax=Pseudonocardia sp. RS010 TaxID=3385979 RepID=UPI0039A03B35
MADNGMQFTGAYVRPERTEVLFERTCRRNGIDHLRTKIRSPTTTGKIERFHQSIQGDLLDPHLAAHGPFPDIGAAQAAVDAWVHDYNHSRPHQARDMDTPAAHFVPVPACERAELPLWAPPELTGIPTPAPAQEPATPVTGQVTEAAAAAASAPLVPAVDLLPPPAHRDLDALAPVELDRVVPAGGNLAVAGQQFWLGTARTGQTVSFWIDTTTVHLAVDGTHLKTLPSRITTAGLARLRADGARPAGPPPAHPAAADGAPVEVHRLVNSSGNVSLAGQHLSVAALLPRWSAWRLWVACRRHLLQAVRRGRSPRVLLLIAPRRVASLSVVQTIRPTCCGATATIRRESSSASARSWAQDW